MAALAGVAPYRVGEAGDLLERREQRAGEDAAALVASRGVVAEGAKLADLAEGASRGTERLVELLSHLLVLSVLLLPYA